MLKAEIFCLFCLFLGLCPLVACGPTNHEAMEGEPRTPPAREVPTHVLTEAEVGTVTEAEVGDWVEVHLPEPDEPLAWEPRGTTALEAAGPEAGEVRETEEGPVRVFRYRAIEIGETGLTFALGEPGSEASPRRTLEFPVYVR